MAADSRYRVILTGYGKGKGEYYIELDFAKAFEISHADAKALFKALPATLKEDVSESEAEQFKLLIETAGAKCELEDMRFNISGLSLV